MVAEMRVIRRKVAANLVSRNLSDIMINSPST
jgi:hypothetical protein